MNWVLIAVLLVMAFFIVRGYRKGFLHIVYSLVAWLIALVFVVWTMPYVNQFLAEKTAIQEKLGVVFEEAIQRKTEIEVLEGPEDKGDQISALGIILPESVIEDILDKTAGAADEFLESSGVYAELAGHLAELAVKGIAFLITLLAAWLVVQLISKLLGLVSKLPLIHGANQTLGLLAGAIYGLLIVWLFFCVATFGAASEFGTTVVSYIYESRLMTFLYENNLLLGLILLFF